MRRTAASLAIFTSASLLMNPSAAHAAGISFAPYASYDTGSGQGPGPAPVSTVAADFNGDGSADVATVRNVGQGNAALLLNDGDGTFGAAGDVSGSSGAQSLAAGDVDGDGDPDIVGMTSTSAIVLKNNGSGAFSVAQTVPVTSGAQIQAILVDADGDSDLDIVAQTFGSIQTRLNNGSGSFSDGPTTSTPGDYFVSAIAPARLNTDNKKDLLAVDGASGTIFSLLGSSTGAYTIGGRLYGGGLIPEDVQPVDLNNDGIDDVAGVGSFSFTLATGLSNGSGGFSSTTATLQWGGPGPTSAGVGDFDGDGRDDIVISSLATPAPKLRFHTNNGTVTPPLAGEFAVGALPQNPTIADYNNDGRLDVAVAGPGSLSVLLNTTP